ncbi:hypothetical protein PaG_06582 [Moesziomyces aphidis]|uniref:Uncharacterized protein n=1 Tax=Moesziomyces aphidis TaxID=84754 RepID=W3VDP7_MOEAP|nr:hypothetical protein PaG_06582 [Moesziomyces aphidis]
MGKVHGSLARAGKVKSQTPKVEKQEKAKQPKGRAKKRLLYTRRSRQRACESRPPSLHHEARSGSAIASLNLLWRKVVATRIFVNAVTTPGGKRRMNPNGEK